jgi:hypothetical protein
MVDYNYLIVLTKLSYGLMKTGLLSILLAAVSPIQVNLESHDQIEVGKS